MFMKSFLILLLLSETIDKESLRFIHSSEQGYDTSCGLTALACLIDRYWGIPADERSLAETYLANKLAAGNLTISFADMALILHAKGFVWKAYRMSYDQLEQAAAAYAPMIIHYDKPEGHFALLISARDGELVIGDPAEGTTLRGREYFESRWSGAVLLAANPEGRLNEQELVAATLWAQGRSALLDESALRSADLISR